MKKLKLILLITLMFSTITNQIMADRLKDMVSFAGIRTNQLMGYGIVVGWDEGENKLEFRSEKENDET